jgi:hypothetical protein
MAKRPVTFRKADLCRALKGVTEAGLPVERVEIEPDGKIVLIPGRCEGPPENEWDAIT